MGGKARKPAGSLGDASTERLLEIAADLDQDEFLEILFNVAADLAAEGVSDEEITLSCGRICNTLGIDLKRVLN